MPKLSQQTKLSEAIIINDLDASNSRKSPGCKHRTSAEAAVAIGALLIITRKLNNTVLVKLVEMAGEQLVSSEGQDTQGLIKSILIWSQTDVRTSEPFEKMNS